MVKEMNLSASEFDEKYKKFLLGVQEECSKKEQTELPLKHDFAPGVYGRRIFMPAGTFVIGKTHKTAHFNIVLSGRANVMIDGQIRPVKAGDVFVSGELIKKVLYILEDMWWLTIHPTDSQDLSELEKEVVLTDEEEKLFLEGKLCLAEVEKEQKKVVTRAAKKEPRKAAKRGRHYDMGNGCRRRSHFGGRLFRRTTAGRGAGGRQ